MKKKSLLLIKMMSKLLFYGLSLQMMFIGVLLAENSEAQDMKNIRKVYVDIQVKDADVEEVFRKLEKKTNFRFTYDVKDVSSVKINLNKYNRSLYDVLEEISKQGKLHFRQTNYDIDVKKLTIDTENKTPVEVIIQTRNITGKVTSYDDGEGLPGVNVVEKGTSNGTVTDVQGEYSLEVSEGATIVFSSVGYTQEEVELGNQSVIDLVMTQDIQQLQELVVVGYGTVNKSDLTGSVTSLKPKDINQGVITSVDQGIRGRAAGVLVTQVSGAPGAGTTIRIRGTNSIQGDNDPLYVVDGVPLTGGGAAGGLAGVAASGLSHINPADIESIEILKDASATAIYGSRGANGVVLISTKRGSKGDAKVDFQASYGVQQLERKIEMADASQYYQIQQEIAAYNNQTAPPAPPAGVDTDWQDEIYRTAPVHNYQVNISGGNESVQYLISGNYFSQDGIIRGSDFNRYNLRLNLNANVSEKLKVGTNLNYAITRGNTISDQQNGLVHSALVAQPIVPVFDENGEYTLWVDDLRRRSNPLAAALLTTSLDKRSRLIGDVNGEYQIKPNLSFRSSFGVDLSDGKANYYLPTTVGEGTLFGGLGRIGTNESRYWINTNTLSYDKTFQDNHSLKVMVGVSWEEFNQETTRLEGTGFVTDNLSYHSMSSAEDQRISSFANRFALHSYIGRLNYGFKDKYLFTFTGRIDGSSRFGEDNKYAFFPSGAFAWRAIDEEFISNVNLFSDLKFRLSYGSAGEQAIPPYQSLSTLSDVLYPLGFANAGFAVGYFPNRLGNNELRWERTTQFDIGVDFAFFDNRLSITADYYRKVTDDLLFEVRIPQTSGFTNALTNIGSIENTGFEFSFNSRNITGAFEWSTDFNIAFNRNKLLSLEDGVTEIISPSGGIIESGSNSDPSILRVGEPLGLFYGFLTDGYFENQEEADNSTQSNARPGQFRIVDYDENGEINFDDRTIIGDPNPDFIGGITNYFKYKGFDLSIFFNWSVGNDIYNMGRKLTYAPNDDGNFQTAFYNKRWTVNNTNSEAPVPAWGHQEFADKDYFIEDGSYLRLRNITFGYNFPANMIKNVSNIRLFVSADNLLTITNYLGYNPEVSSFGNGALTQGVDLGTYPNPRIFMAGLNVGF